MRFPFNFVSHVHLITLWQTTYLEIGHDLADCLVHHVGGGAVLGIDVVLVHRRSRAVELRNTKSRKLIFPNIYSNLKCFRYHVLSVAHAVLGGLILATEGSRILEFFQASVFGYWTNREWNNQVHFDKHRSLYCPHQCIRLGTDSADCSKLGEHCRYWRKSRCCCSTRMWNWFRRLWRIQWPTLGWPQFVTTSA